MNKDEMVADALDVMDRIETLEELIEKANKYIEMTECVEKRNNFTIGDIISYAQKISNTVAFSSQRPQIPPHGCYPSHVTDFQGTEPDVKFKEAIWIKRKNTLDENDDDDSDSDEEEENNDTNKMEEEENEEDKEEEMDDMI